MWESLSERLEGRLVVLEPLAPEHFDELYGAARPPEIWEWWPFDELGCQRVEFDTDEENSRSRRALEALPAIFEGVRRASSLLSDGRRRSSAIYSILDSEWPDVRANLERRVEAHLARPG